MIERLSLPDVQALACDCLVRAGAPGPVAEAVAAEIAAAEAAGERRYGMSALLRDIRLMRYGRIDAGAQAAIGRPRPGLMRCDAAHGFAAAALARAVEALPQLAHRHGIALLRLDRASDPGAMIRATSALAAQGLAALAFGAEGPGRVARPDSAAPARLRHPPRDALAMLLPPGPGGAPSDSPLDGPVAHGAWIIAVDAEATGAPLAAAGVWEAAPAPPPAREIALSSELLEQIVTA